jgi:16S rRNA (uracil1498-N3)-methyltransferase
MSERFFSSEPIISGRITLAGAEAHHMLHVMRSAVGQTVMLFDGSGAEFAAIVDSIGRSCVDLHIVERRDVDRELPLVLTVGVALPKGDRQKWLVEKLTELGAAVLVPLTTERGVAQPAAAALERLRRGTIEAAKQCGRNRLLTIAEPQPATTWFSHESKASDTSLGSSRPTQIVGAHEFPAARLLIAQPGGKPLSELDFAQPLPTHLAIGPEGGFTDNEIAAAQSVGWQAVDLGPRILRVETAAVALVAAVALGAGCRCRPSDTNVH